MNNLRENWLIRELNEKKSEIARGRKLFESQNLKKKFADFQGCLVTKNSSWKYSKSTKRLFFKLNYTYFPQQYFHNNISTRIFPLKIKLLVFRSEFAVYLVGIIHILYKQQQPRIRAITQNKENNVENRADHLSITDPKYFI